MPKRRRTRHGPLSTLWRPRDNHRRHRRSLSDCQDPRPSGLAHQSPAPFSGAGICHTTNIHVEINTYKDPS